MNISDIITTIRNTTPDEIEFFLELLRFRGFLIDQDGSISENSHNDDEAYLKYLLQKYRIGDIENRKIIICSPDNFPLFLDEFSENIQIPRESCWTNADWKISKYRIHGRKAEVRYLEPFIARYIKAISSCGVSTIGSCDGNHPNAKQIYIMMEDPGSIVWHSLICKKILLRNSPLVWINEFTAIPFTQSTKYETYYHLNNAAAFLYNHRLVLRDIKKSTLRTLPNTLLKHGSSEEIEEKFIKTAGLLIDKMF